MKIKRKIRKIYLYAICVFATYILFFVAGCKNSYTPKPIGYFRINFPEKAYQLYTSDCPFQFEYPVYAKVVADDSKNAEPCWLNIEFPKFNGTIHLSYKHVMNNLDKFTEDTRKLTFKHTIKAEAINEKTFDSDKDRVYGILYDVKGEAASAAQFYLTDSVNHFIRGSLYINVEPNKDSLAPVIDFLHKDIIHFIETLRWKDGEMR